jgi:hypothetical protein
MTVAETEGEELDKYFTPQVPDVTTTLLVPLKLTPTVHLLLTCIFTYNHQLLAPSRRPRPYASFSRAHSHTTALLVPLARP